MDQAARTRRRSRPSIAVAARAALAALAALVPSQALACAVCFSAEEGTLEAFYGTAILLTSMPFVLVGSVVWFVRRRVNALEDAEGLAGEVRPEDADASAS